MNGETMPSDPRKYQDALLALVDFSRIPPVAPLTDAVDTITFFRLEYRTAGLPVLIATFARVEENPLVMAVHTSHPDPRLNVAAIYSATEARTFYRQLIALDFVPF
jgi:hypothetical protein